ncbi:GntR family transcriptional regulator [Streptomyces zagrosensis]|uniref:DNA-binding GntR family transcriptional regulator n=1 Tax=Streptomyces zagrosensis TaxID=1042984 RepID=A0A7W9QDR8_9ACTN|nr:GntR family transcriptional regulator [Streptomyces zagrosensis]MBB5937132.1 DNA-binding GntR family transcriptional regulator [Streptomyces zagrosensis]
MGTTQLNTVPEPKYWHLKTVLSTALDSEFAVGEILPNERELAARFGVARATLRQALEQLELEGRLQRRRGVGTTVAPPRMGVAVGDSKHVWPGAVADPWQALDSTQGEVPAAVAQFLGASPDELVYTVRRALTTAGQPVAAELLYVPAGSVPALNPSEVAAVPAGVSVVPAASGPTRARTVLRELHRMELEGQERAVELGSARADDARALDRLPGAPVLVVTTRYLAEGRTAAVSVATYRADTCRLTFGDTGPDLLAG